MTGEFLFALRPLDIPGWKSFVHTLASLRGFVLAGRARTGDAPNSQAFGHPDAILTTGCPIGFGCGNHICNINSLGDVGHSSDLGAGGVSSKPPRLPKRSASCIRKGRSAGRLGTTSKMARSIRSTYYCIRNLRIMGLNCEIGLCGRSVMGCIVRNDFRAVTKRSCGLQRPTTTRSISIRFAFRPSIPKRNISRGRSEANTLEIRLGKSV